MDVSSLEDAFCALIYYITVQNHTLYSDGVNLNFCFRMYFLHSFLFNTAVLRSNAAPAMHNTRTRVTNTMQVEEEVFYT